MDHMAAEPTITAAVLAALVGISQRRIESNIRTLREAGLIRREGPTKNGRWVVHVEAVGS